MNIADISIRYRVITLAATVGLTVGGVISYQKLGRLEDPEFTIKNAQVITRYPGASAMEVAEEVTDKLETAVQQMGQLNMVTSMSKPGLSIINVEMKDKYDKVTLPQVWDELRRKVSDAQGKLPPGAGPSVVNDDYGDVFGIFYAVYGDGYTYAELQDYVDLLRRELLLVQDVGKVMTFGELSEVVYVEISRARMAQLGLNPELIYSTLSGQNLVRPSGHADVGSFRLRIQPSGGVGSIEDLQNLLILQDDGAGSRLYLKDIAHVYRGYQEPPGAVMRFNGRQAIGLGISTVSGGNVVTMGTAVKQRLAELEAETPIGIEMGVISHQADSVTVAISSFIISLVEAIAIVIGVLVFAMGFRSGVLIGGILLLTVLATFIFMKMQGIMLERISLGALIIALGMLVDNAIVVVEGILVNAQKGVTKREAASQVVQQTVWPLFGATVVAVLAFAAIGVSQDSTGEYCRSLFQVILISLMLSWVLAITVTPLFGVMFLKVESSSSTNADPYAGKLFQGYKKFLELCIRNRWITVAVLVLALIASVKGFGHVRQSFFPPSTRPQFMVHYWLPQGKEIRSTEADIKKIEQHLLESKGVTDVCAFVGQGAPRFLLTFTPENPNTSYGLFLVSVDDEKIIDPFIPELQTYLDNEFPDAQAFSRKFMLGPGDPNKIQVRFRGPDPDILRRLASEANRIFAEDPNIVDIMDDWRQRMPLIRPVVAETQARNAGITRAQIANTLQVAFEGLAIGQYREGDLLLPIIARSPANERADIANLKHVQIYSPVAGKSIPISQIVLGLKTVSENAVVQRRDRLPTITVKCDPRVGEAAPALNNIRPHIERRFNEMVAEMNVSDYTLEWGGEYENSRDAQAAMASKLPLVFLMMIFIVVCLFNSIMKPVVIFLTVPLAIIGVTVGLLVCNQPFGFMALLGMLSLIGMLIKNAIVLIDEITLQLSEGKEPYTAIVESGLSRLRPVSMAALTTVLGMIPLIVDAFFASMAVTIMFGLTFATILTLIVIPVLFAIFFKVPNPSR